MKRNSTLILIVVVIVAALLIWWPGMNGDTSKVNPPVACTMEAKICPDGSAVGRTGPLCEFAACPDVTSRSQSVISGSVTLSPICPVERMPPDPKCAPKPFATEIRVFDENMSTLIRTIQSLNDGSFTLTLPYGNYTFQATGRNPLPQCASINLSVQTSIIKEVNISCDTGIR